jgi:hypothetical protein
MLKILLLRRQIAARYFYLPTPCQIGDSGLERNLWPRIGRINPPKIQSNRGARAAPRRATIVTHVAAVKAAGAGIALCRAQVTVFQRRNAAKERRQQSADRGNI